MFKGKLLILSETTPIVPVKKESFYRKFLQPVIDTYQRIGIPAEYKSINDIVAGGRKISGTGVGEIGSNVVFIGIRMGKMSGFSKGADDFPVPG